MNHEGREGLKAAVGCRVLRCLRETAACSGIGLEAFVMSQRFRQCFGMSLH